MVRYSAQSREIRALGRVLDRVADLARTQMAAFEARTCGDACRVDIAEKRVAECVQRLRKGAHVLDRMLVERGDQDSVPVRA